MRRAGPLIVAALAATVAVPIILGGKAALWQTVNLPLQGYLALFAVIAISWFARSLKLQLLLLRLGMRPGFRRTFLISLATDFAFISTPGGVGGYAASIYYLRRAGTSVSGAASITAVDQLLDLSFFALVLPFAGMALLWSDLPETLAVLAFSTSATMIGLALTALIARRKVAAWLFGNNFISRRWPGLQRRQHAVRDFLVSLQANARFLLAGGWLFLCEVFVLTAFQWFGRYGVLWVALAILGHRVSFALTLLLQSLVLHAAMWTGVPSGGGGAELGLSAALSNWVPATSIATALLLWRMATLYVCLIAGAIAIALLARRSKQNPHVQIARSPPVEEGAG